MIVTIAVLQICILCSLRFLTIASPQLSLLILGGVGGVSPFTHFWLTKCVLCLTSPGRLSVYVPLTRSCPVDVRTSTHRRAETWLDSACRGLGRPPER